MTRHLSVHRRLAVQLLGCVLTGAVAMAQAPAAKAPPPISADALMTTVRTLASKEYQGRAAGTEGNAKARAYIRQRFQTLGLQPIGTSFDHQFAYTPRQRNASGAAAKPGTGVNVIGRCAGTDPSLPVIVLSAHYDHLGVRNARLYPGADDNASGTAAILELAAQCVAVPFRRDLVIAAFDAEEGGLNGARAFVTAGLVPKDRIAVNVNLDMVARGDKGEIYISGMQHHPALKALLEPVAAKAPVRVRFGHDEPGSGDNDWTLQSDHGEFHKMGVPFVYFGVEDHPDYHQPTDTADKINPEFFVKAVVMIHDALRALDAGLK